MLYILIMAENFPNGEQGLGMQMYDTTPKSFNLKRSLLTYIIIKLSKLKNNVRNLKAAREETIT